MRIVAYPFAFFAVLASAQTWEEEKVDEAFTNWLTEILSTEKYYSETMTERACWSSVSSVKTQLLANGRNYCVHMQGCLSESLGISESLVGHCSESCQPNDYVLKYYFAAWENVFNITSIKPANMGDC
ncbi:hypothetical protein PsorP6_009830 [Peronosclerospora sorghi]|uniref:Uncharacterized protein n=1 Tax=Peronosclerospora sorghi TaxID=230839 RepID=A0ACC0VYK5_9STRA|nr:hypothetical protein PsorP6_009830 [Peronosclerospora sorghi]